MRPLLLPLAFLLPLGGCGGSPEGPRVEVVVSSVDGALPSGLRVRSREDATRTHPLVAAPPSEGARVFVAEGAPDGYYQLEADGDWGMIWPNRTPPELRRGAPEPISIQIGRSHTLYVASGENGQSPGETWAAEAVVPGGPGRPLFLRAEVDDRGVAALRFAPRDWTGEIRAVGRMSSGRVTTEVRTRPPEDGRPSLRSAAAAPLLPLVVRFVGPSPPEGAVVRVRVEEIPLDVSFEHRVRAGEAAFEGIPYLDRPLSVSTEGTEGAFRLDPVEWRDGRELRLASLPADAPSLRLTVSEPTAVASIQVRGADWDSYGLVPFRVEGDAIVFRVPAGRCSLLLRSERRWATLGEVEGGSEAAIVAPEFAAAGALAVRVLGPGGILRVLRIEGEREVSAHGFARRLRDDDSVEVLLPGGAYRVVLEGAGGGARPAAAVRVAPGASSVLPLDTRR